MTILINDRQCSDFKGFKVAKTTRQLACCFFWR